MRTRNIRFLTTALFAALFLAPQAAWAQPSPAPTPAQTPAPSSDESVTAVFEGRVIQLAEGWAGATACVIQPEIPSEVPSDIPSEIPLDGYIPSTGVVNCFRTYEEADAFTAGLSDEYIAEPANTAAGAARGPGGPCEHWNFLYEHQHYGGRRLSFRDTFIQNLTKYGFNDALSSFNLGADCDVIYWEHVEARGDSRSYGVNVELRVMPAGWNDKASSFLLRDVR